MNKVRPYLAFYFALLIIIAAIVGIYTRFYSSNLWKKNEALFFYKGEPLYSEYDSFYFARLAQDIKEGIFKIGKIDNFRFFPDNCSKAKLKGRNFYTTYNISGNLISAIWAYLSKIFNINLAKLTWYLAPIFAVTFIIPIFLYFKDMGYPYAGILAAIVGAISPMYFLRTGLMRLDTDLLNITLPVLTGYFFFKFFETESFKKKFLWSVLGSLSLFLYYLWYAHANLCFVLFCVFLFRYVLDRRFRFVKEDAIFILIVLLPQIWYIWQGPSTLFFQIRELVFNIKHTTSVETLFKDFPNIFISISELQHLKPSGVLYYTFPQRILTVLGFIGMILFFIKEFKRLIFILPYFLIGLLAFVSGARFVMYLGIFAGAGLGFLIYFVFDIVLTKVGLFDDENKKELVKHVIGTSLFVITIVLGIGVKNLYSTPKIYSPLVKDMVFIRENTPKNSAIWTWWDYGYAFQLYARRATFHDGGSQWSPKTYFIARSFATDSPKEAWYVTSFVSNYGLFGIAKQLLSGVTAKQLVSEVEKGKFAKPIKTPVYWVFTKDLLFKFPWIYYFGSYNFDTKKGKKIVILQASQCSAVTNSLLKCVISEGGINVALIDFDLSKGVFFIEKALPGAHIAEYLGAFNNIGIISKFYLRKNKIFKQIDFGKKGIVIDYIFVKNRPNILVFPYEVGMSMFNQMYLLRNYDKRYFTLVLDDFPTSVIYKVNENIKGR
ncbi:MAG: hypothetical protein GXO57_08950 [Thermodesulfobacteria bacterium]|nr:hypothetical protein [Thermodesulfobacteriota bacterium]